MKMKSTKSNPNHQRLLQTNCHIGIVGSGLGGLAAALAILQCNNLGIGKKKQKRTLKQKSEHGCTMSFKESGEESNTTPSCSFQGRITIYERDLHATDRKEGYGMTLTYNPAGPLAQLGILESIARRDCPSRSHYLFNERGDVKGYYGNAFHNLGDEAHDDTTKLHLGSASRGSGQRGNLRIPRAELRSILMDKIREADEQNSPSKVNVAWGKRLVSYVDRPAVEKLNQIHSGEHIKNNPTSNVHVSEGNNRPVLLQFEDGTTDEVDLLIGADGVNSVVAKQYLATGVASKTKQSAETNAVSPKYLGIFIVIGISDHMHPLIDERGYYTLDGEQRLFIMPFEGSRLEARSRRTMWQLSYPVADREEALRLSKLNPPELQAEVLKRCGCWHQPFPEMVKQTPHGTIWGT
jgi:2-polyprenyl-6-methoxyphenol hydroxylase-like FAD-dependent oxidoreductase